MVDMSSLDAHIIQIFVQLHTYYAGVSIIGHFTIYCHMYM